jgi:branched-chain amino acid transport system substrate-binding protein
VPYVETGNAEVRTYLDKLRRYGPSDASPSVLSQAGFALVMDLHRLLSSLDPGGITPVALTDKLRAARDEPSFMGHPYTCDGQAVTILPAICSTWVRLLQYKGAATFDDVGGDWVNGADLVKLLTS